MIFVRDDDVLMASSQWPDPFVRFKEVHEMICRYDFALHVPALLTSELDKFPEAIQYIRTETNAGRMQPEFHGIEHIDYANLTSEEILWNYMQAQGWFYRNIGVEFTKHYTPWGAGADERGAHIGPTAAHAGIVMVTCANLLEPEHIIADPDASQAKYEGREIFIHWWAGIGKLQRALDKLR
jgi:hypothetical protein